MVGEEIAGRFVFSDNFNAESVVGVVQCLGNWSVLDLNQWVTSHKRISNIIKPALLIFAPLWLALKSFSNWLIGD